MAHVYKRHDTWWLSAYLGPGKPRVRKRIGRSKEEAELFLAGYEEAVRQASGNEEYLAGVLAGMADGLRSMSLSIRAMADDFVNAKRGTIKDSTLEWYTRYLYRFVDAFEDQDFRALTLGRVNAWLTECPSAKNNYIRTLRAFGHYCDDERTWSDNPLLRLKAKAPPARQRTIPWARVIKVAENIEGTPLHGPFLAAAYAGLRANEICHARLEHLDRENHTLTIRPIDIVDDLTSGGPRRVQWGPKSWSDRRSIPTPLHPKLFAAIREGTEGWIFLNSAGRKWTRHDLYRKIHAVADCGLHVLRHTFISRLMAAGHGSSIVRDIARHSSIVVTDGYSHTLPTELRNAVDALP